MVDYIRELRRRVGNFPLVMVGAGVLVLDDQDRLLLLRRTDNGCWGIPGGALEPGETLEAAARRELCEETGLDAGPLELLDVFSGPELHYVYPDGAEVHNVSAVYLARKASGALRLDPGEHRDYRWFALAGLPEDISPPVKPVLRAAVNRLAA